MAVKKDKRTDKKLVQKLMEQEEAVLNNIKFSLEGLKTAVPGKNSGKVVYASAPITTGKQMYDMFREYGVSSVDGLNEIDPCILRESIMNRNIGDGIEFGDEIRKQDVGPVIVPGAFFARGWTQAHYMSLWEQVINMYADIVCMNKDYAYSNGCVEELLLGISMGKELRHREGFAPLDPYKEAGRIRDAIDEIEDLGVQPKKLYDLYRRISLSLDAGKYKAARK